MDQNQSNVFLSAVPDAWHPCCWMQSHHVPLWYVTFWARAKVLRASDCSLSHGVRASSMLGHEFCIVCLGTWSEHDMSGGFFRCDVDNADAQRKAILKSLGL